MTASRIGRILILTALAWAPMATDGGAQARPSRPRLDLAPTLRGAADLLPQVVGTVTAPIGSTLPAAKPLVRTVDAAVPAVTAPVAAVTAPVATAVAPLVSGVVGAVGAVANTTTTAITPVVGAAAQTAGAVTAPVLQTVGAVTAPIGPTVAAVLGPVTNTSQQLVGEVLGATQATAGLVGATVQSLPNTLGQTAGPVPQGTSNVIAGAPSQSFLAASGARVTGIAVSPGLLMGGGPATSGTTQVVATQAAVPEGPAFDAAPNETRRDLGLRLARLYPQALESDADGQLIVRGEVLRIGERSDAAAAARRLGFEVRNLEGVEALRLEVTVFTAPAGVGARQAARRLAELEPAAQYVVNPIYLPTGQAVGGRGGPPSERSRSGGAPARVSVGLIDGGVATEHPSLAGAEVVQQGFAPGGARPTAHGTAVASLIAGREGAFRSAAPGARLYAADVYGSGPTGGSATAVVQGLAWLATQPVKVINISLAGPPSPVLEAAIRALAARGRVLVAAVGNDGPASPPSYPSAYPGVVAVTAVNGRMIVLPEAGRGGHVDFAAPGADMAAADAGSGFTAVRGTSFAAPLVAGRLAEALSHGASREEAMSALSREAVDLGAPGRDPVYGAGLIAFDLRTPPEAVSASVLARR